MNKLEKLLKDIFKKERLVFWYDDDATMRSEFEALHLDPIVKVEVVNDEFSVKYRIMRQEPNEKFLLYFAYPRPTDIENWMLDLNLANRIFSTDQAALILEDFGWDYSDKDFVEKHYAFFGSKRRVDGFKKRLLEEDSIRARSLKMLAVICSCEPDMDNILLALFGEMANGSSKKLDELTKFNFTEFLWGEIKTKFNYSSNTATLKDFLINLFKRNFIDPANVLNSESIVFVSRWMDSSKNQSSFITLSKQLQKELVIETVLQSMDMGDLVDLDIYGLIDQKIIMDLKMGILTETISFVDVQQFIGGREHKFWYGGFEHLYKALKFSTEFFQFINQHEFSFDSLEDGFSKYATVFYNADLLYRKFIYHYGEARQNGVLKDLFDKVEKIYSNTFLLKLNDKWQSFIDCEESWKIPGVMNQRDFFNTEVKPYLDKDQRIFVVISDALRYECAKELTDIINREKRYTARISPMLSTLPSYTQLGMAALLPNKELTYKKDSESVVVDSMSSQGLENRTKILRQTVAESTAISAKDFLAMKTSTEGRQFAKEHKLIYIYHNGIDAVGDMTKSESKVFNAVEEEFKVLNNILNTIANMNGANAIVTSDHGFIYQSMTLDESDFVDSMQKGEDKSSEIYKRNRRFIIGENLPESSSLKKFKGKQFNIDDETEILIPKSINRLRVKGAGSQFVHGGASLQEVVVPVIHFKNKKENTIEFVDVSVMAKAPRITSSQLTVSFYQDSTVAEKCLARSLRIGFYASDNTLISNQFTLSFDSTDSEGGNRVQKQQFILSQLSERYNNQDVELRLEEQVGGSNEFVVYRKYEYKLQKSFTADFDF